jgi:tetratricopeptide (TPR) repeat protein
MNLAGVLSESGAYHDALMRNDEAIALKPLAANGHVNRGLMLRRLAKLGAAVASCDNAIRFAPQNAGAHSGRGDSLRELGQLDDDKQTNHCSYARSASRAEGLQVLHTLSTQRQMPGIEAFNLIDTGPGILRHRVDVDLVL